MGNKKDGYNVNDGLSREALTSILEELFKPGDKKYEPKCLYRGNFIPLVDHPEVQKVAHKIIKEDHGR